VGGGLRAARIRRREQRAAVSAQARSVDDATCAARDGGRGYPRSADRWAQSRAAAVSAQGGTMGGGIRASAIGGRRYLRSAGRWAGVSAQRGSMGAEPCGWRNPCSADRWAGYPRSADQGWESAVSAQRGISGRRYRPSAE
jgi:hypothetical protein